MCKFNPNGNAWRRKKKKKGKQNEIERMKNRRQDGHGQLKPFGIDFCFIPMGEEHLLRRNKYLTWVKIHPANLFSYPFRHAHQPFV